jgi:hypothetical protein
LRTTPKPTVAILAALLLTGCAHTEPVAQRTEPVAQRTEPVAPAAEPTPAAGRPPAADPIDPIDPIDPVHPRQGPASPAVGTPYAFDLYTHCGGEYTRFAGRTWRADNPPGNPVPRADAAGVTRVTGYVYGTMTLLAADQAEFVIDPRGIAGPPADPVVFHPATTAAPLCE